MKGPTEVSPFLKDGTPHKHIILNTNLQAVVVNMNCHRSMTIFLAYLPPNCPLGIGELRQLVKQLPKPFMLQGDFNGTTQRCSNLCINFIGTRHLVPWVYMPL